MSGIRKTDTITCPSCGSEGTVGLGMAMIGARSDYREFACAICKGTVRYQATRAILGISWAANAADQQLPSSR